MQELLSLIRDLWTRRADRYSEERAAKDNHGGGKAARKVEMYTVGG